MNALHDDEAAKKYDTDPVQAILDSRLPQEEQMSKLIDLFDEYGDMDFRDYLPHDVLGDFHTALKGRKESRKALAKAGK